MSDDAPPPAELPRTLAERATEIEYLFEVTPVPDVAAINAVLRAWGLRIEEPLRIPPSCVLADGRTIRLTHLLDLLRSGICAAAFPAALSAAADERDRAN